MAEHTPGPWAYYSYKRSADGTRFFIETEDQRHGLAAIAPNETASTMLTMQEHEANARLIAATPDLLEACKAMVSTWGSDDEDAIIQSRDDAVAAIVKAEGKS